MHHRERHRSVPRAPLTTPLTPRQQDAMDVIAEFQERNNYSPTTREIGDLLGVNQTAATNLVAACERKGKLKRIAGKARTITIVAEVPAC